jgi:hypothetical protein
LFDFNKLAFSRQSVIKVSDLKLNKNPPHGSSADTHRQTGMAKLTVTLGNFVNTLKTATDAVCSLSN